MPRPENVSEFRTRDTSAQSLRASFYARRSSVIGRRFVTFRPSIALALASVAAKVKDELKVEFNIAAPR